MQLYIYLLTFYLTILSPHPVPQPASSGERGDAAASFFYPAPFDSIDFGNLFIANQRQMGEINRSGGMDSLVAPSLVDFGDVRYDSCAERTITITASGPGRIVVNAQLDVAFQIRSPKFPITLDSGMSQEVRIRYCPILPGRDSVALRLFDVNSGRSIYVQLLGRGVGGVLLHRPELSVWGVPGRCDTIPVPVRNGGNVLLTITSIAPFATPSLSYYAPTLPHTIDSGVDDTLYLLFCPSGPVDIVDSLSLVYSDGYRRTAFMVLFGGIDTAGVTINRELIDFGALTAGECNRDSFLIAGNLVDTMIVDSVWIESVSGNEGAFTIVVPDNLPVAIPPRKLSEYAEPDKSILVVVDYCPTQAGTDSAYWRARLRGGMLTDSVLLLGNASPGAGRLFWADTIFSAVGALDTMWVWGSDTMNPDIPVQWRSMRIGYDRRSVHVGRAISIGGDSLLFSHENDSVVTVELVGTPAPGAKLFGLELVGLTTGRQLSNVRIIEVTLDSRQVVTQTMPGLVVLTGCDLERGLGIGRRVTIRSVRSSIGSNDLTVLYSAPNRTIPMASLIDINGQVVWSLDLPYANGGEQAARIGLNGFARGFYLFQLRIGEDRSVTPIMIGW